MTTDLMTDTDTVLHVAHRDVAKQPLTLDEAVRRRRTELGWNQHDVARRTGLSPWGAKQIERGLLTPSHAARLALESALDLPMGALDNLPVGGDGTAPTIGLGRIEKVVEATRRPKAVARPRPWVHVVSACGEVNLAQAVNECLGVISAAGDHDGDRFDLSAPYVEGIDYLASPGDWVTAIVRYQAAADLFPTDPDEDGSVYVERSQRPRT